MALDFTKNYSTDFNLIDAGKYPSCIVGAEWKNAKTNGDKYLKIVIKITEGIYAKRLIFTNLNVYSSNPTARDIAMRNLCNLLKAIGSDLSKLNDLSDDGLLELIANRHFLAKVKKTPAKGDFDAKNEIDGYYKLDNQPDQFANPTDLPF